MSVIATVIVPAADFALGRALVIDPDIRIRIERTIPVGDTVIPYLWISDHDVSLAVEALEADPHVESARIVDRVDGESLVKIEWTGEIDGLLTVLADSDGVMLQADGQSDAWTFQLRFPTHQTLATFFRTCRDRGIGVDLQRVHNPGVPEELGMHFSLTDTQRETLQTALATGYFDVPRETTLVELAERLGVSDSAVSQRLRRGIATLVAATLDERDGGGSEGSVTDLDEGPDRAGDG
ncbi:MAG: helix-turn-helix domain-containing protein [Haloarculaceae archaeon]